MEIILKGTGKIIDSIVDEEDYGDIYEFAFIFNDVEVTADGIDITKNKGKYVKSKTWIKDHYLITDTNPHYFMVIDRVKYFEFRFILDCDEFDPKKVQLIKSDYEVPFIPYGIVADVILYDGKEITAEWDDENFDFPMSDTYIEKVDM